MLTFKQLNESRDYQRKEGESKVLHHVTPVAFNKFKPMSHFGTANAARAVAADKFNMEKTNDLRMNRPIKSLTKKVNKTKFYSHSVRLKLGKVAHISDYEGSQHSPSRVVDLLIKHKVLPIKATNSLLKKSHDHLNGGPPLTHNHIAKALNAHGIDTLKYKNHYEDEGKMSYIITRPDQVRTLRKKSKSNLNLKKGWKHLSY